MGTFQAALIALLVFGYMVYRLCVTRPVTYSNLLIPLAGAVYLAVTYINQSATVTVIMMGIGAALAGISTGMVGARFVTVWRDKATGFVMQRGGWKYVLVLLGLIGVRILLRVAAHALRLDASETALNDAFIGMAVGNYAGRAALVGLRAQALAGTDGSTLPGTRD